MKRILVVAFLIVLSLVLASTVMAGPQDCSVGETEVPGHCGRDGEVNGHFTTDLGGYHYIVNYQGDFGGDSYLDSGRIMNVIHGAPGSGEVYVYQIVSQGSPQYDGGNPVWGTWDYHVLVVAGEGNVTVTDHVGNGN